VAPPSCTAVVRPANHFLFLPFGEKKSGAAAAPGAAVSAPPPRRRRRRRREKKNMASSAAVAIDEAARISELQAEIRRLHDQRAALVKAREHAQEADRRARDKADEAKAAFDELRADYTACKERLEGLRGTAEKPTVTKEKVRGS
jgi:hypothetical protein